MNEWVKSAEMLPTEVHSGPYLVYTLDNDRSGPDIVAAYYLGGGEWSQVCDGTIGEVTHWMNFPDKPTELSK